MRVIGGKFKSRRLKTLPGTRTRPTSDPLRETLFNILGARIVDAVFADCYAGSGAVGIEALSRGAAKVYFLESYGPAAALIRGNLSSLGIHDGFEILPTDVLRSLERLVRRNVVLNFAFLDPPYTAVEEYERTLTYLGNGKLLACDAEIIAEHTRRTVLPERIGCLVCARRLRQGDSALTFYRVVE